MKAHCAQDSCGDQEDTEREREKEGLRRSFSPLFHHLAEILSFRSLIPANKRRKGAYNTTWRLRTNLRRDRRRPLFLGFWGVETPARTHVTVSSSVHSSLSVSCVIMCMTQAIPTACSIRVIGSGINATRVRWRKRWHDEAVEVSCPL
jgi:hypothetical protein